MTQRIVRHATCVLCLTAALTTTQAQVTLDRNAHDGDYACYAITNEVGTYYLQKPTGGFSKFVDLDGNDWIDHDKDVSGAKGEYRGFPNGAGFHPGRDPQAEATVEEERPDYVAIRVTRGTCCEALWEFYPTVVYNEVVKANTFWYLYEGPVGGDHYDKETTWWMTEDGAKHYHDDDLDRDISSPEWYCTGIDGLTRALLFVNRQDDGTTDWFTRWGDMVIAAFGRDGFSRTMEGPNRPFAFGFVETDDAATLRATAAQWLAGPEATAVHHRRPQAPARTAAPDALQAWHSLLGRSGAQTAAGISASGSRTAATGLKPPPR